MLEEGRSRPWEEKEGEKREKKGKKGERGRERVGQSGRGEFFF